MPYFFVKREAADSGGRGLYLPEYSSRLDLADFSQKRNWRVGMCMSGKICKFVAYFMRASVKMAWLDPATLDIRCNIILSSL